MIIKTDYWGFDLWVSFPASISNRKTITIITRLDLDLTGA